MGLVIKLILNSKLSSLSLCDIPLRESRLWQRLGDILAFLCVVLQVYPSKKQGKFQLNDNKILTSDAHEQGGLRGLHRGKLHTGHGCEGTSTVYGFWINT